ncbi:MAG: hypothetical protein IPK71_32535 [Myxococcales bacterium]|nr:hypothetical protein [Myxococcales bacterium]
MAEGSPYREVERRGAVLSPEERRRIIDSLLAEPEQRSRERAHRRAQGDSSRKLAMGGAVVSVLVLVVLAEPRLLGTLMATVTVAAVAWLGISRRR